MKFFSFGMVVDLDKTNYEDLVELVVQKYSLGYLEVAHIQYYDEGLKSFLEVKNRPRVDVYV
jgi:Fe-S cluster assembly iron-binding protein IscA